MANTNLANAKTAKNDEFYTQYSDIQKEINAYLDYDPNVFRGKTVPLPCDDPEWSNFTKFFAQNFELLGLKKLISTSYAPESKKYKIPYQPTLFETEQPHFNADKSKTHGKIFVLERDVTGDNRINIEDLQWQYLEGDGDFRSKEIRKLRDEADIIVTNTAKFSLYVSPYLVANQGGRYTKHIYIGSQRIVSKLGDLDSYGSDPRRIPYAGSEADAVTVDYKGKYASEEVGISWRKLARYNERDKHDVLSEGDLVYLKKKRKKADKMYKRRPHIVKPGESMYSIAQHYGMRIKYLYKKNDLTPDYQIKVGDRLRVY